MCGSSISKYNNETTNIIFNNSMLVDKPYRNVLSIKRWRKELRKNLNEKKR